MNTDTFSRGEIILYQTADGRTSVDVKLENETVWLSKEQMAVLFERDRTVISRHIKNIFEEGELDEKVVCAKFAHTTPHGAIEGKTQTKEVSYYNLDVVISVGYRVKSLQGVRFRQWATRVLREMLLNRLEEVKRISNLERRTDALENDVKHIKGGMDYLFKQVASPDEPPRRRIGFGADENDLPAKPYAKL